MVYCSAGSLERIMFHPYDNLEETHYIDLTMSNCDAAFAVTTCCDEEWIWEFYYDKTTYDLVKHIVMDCIFEAEDIEELIEMIDEAFEQSFADVVVNETEMQDEIDMDVDVDMEIECDGCCGKCNTEDKGDLMDKFNAFMKEMQKFNKKRDKGE